MLILTSLLVFCPNHLVQQWESEIKKHTNPPMCVISLTTKRDLDITSYSGIQHVVLFDFIFYAPQDIVEADIILVSYSLMKNPNYLGLGRVCMNIVIGNTK